MVEEQIKKVNTVVPPILCGVRCSVNCNNIGPIPDVGQHTIMNPYYNDGKGWIFSCGGNNTCSLWGAGTCFYVAPNTAEFCYNIFSDPHKV